jgi:hypothetical protein
MTFQLDKIIPWGRSFNEYIKMFSLSNEDLKLKIISCADGPASFNHHMNKMGKKVISVDPIYQFTKNDIKLRINETFKTVIEQTEKNKSEFVWKKIKTIDELAEIRKKTMDLFLSDYESGKSEGRYIFGSLPELKFKTKQFDLALCSHFLFLYSKQLSCQFHIDSITELCRTAKEVRIFPILELGSNVSRHFAKVCTHLQTLGFKTEIINVEYEFQKGGNQLLKIHANQAI